jgi:hypothetical protein
VVVPYPAAGNADITGRVIAKKMGVLLNTTVIVENRSGANGMIGTDAVVKAPADGYTLLMAASGPIVINPVLYTKVPYDPIKDLQPISQILSFQYVLVVSAASSINTLNDAVLQGKAQPGKLSFGSTAGTAQLFAVWAEAVAAAAAGTGRGEGRAGAGVQGEDGEAERETARSRARPRPAHAERARARTRLLAAVDRVHEHDAVLVLVALEGELPHDAALRLLEEAAHVLHLEVKPQRARQAHGAGRHSGRLEEEGEAWRFVLPGSR